MRVLEYAYSLSAGPEIIWWINNTAKAAIKKNLTTEDDLEHIIDWMIHGDAPARLQKMSIQDAKRKTNEWMEKNIKRGSQIKDSEDDIEVFMDFNDGFKFVRLLTKKAFQREGSMMSHCLGGYQTNYGVQIYSLRDRKNNPHCTIEVRKDKEINQIKGKGNGSIHPKYIEYVLNFLDKVGTKIRPNEMQNLGYYHVDKSHIKFIKEIGRESELVNIRDEFYAF